MKRYTNPLLFASFAVVLLAQSALGQTKAKPSPSYEGQSLPPASDAIVASPETPEPTLSTRPATEPAPAATPAPAPVPAAQPVAAVAAPSNPDAGIVGDTPATVASTTTASNLEPTLYERSVNPDADIVQVQPKHSGALDTGTLIRVRIQEALSTSKTAPGDPFSAIVMSPVEQSGKVIIPMGSEVKGRVVSVHAGKAMRGKATMRLRPDVVTMPDGSRYMLHAQVVETQGTDTRADSEGFVTSKSHVKKDAIQYGAVAGGGAIVGATLGGPTGALVGAGIGAGFVTVHLLVQNHQAQLPKDSVLIFGLTEPMTFLAVQN